jgi:glycine/D-amino acid oxidase-like deaminating enzyme
LCGTLLSKELLARGKSILVIDEERPNTASKVASGVINPVTGRRIARTWRIEELLPFAWSAYTNFGNDLGVEIVKQCNILDFHPIRQMAEAFNERVPDEPYLSQVDDPAELKQIFNFHYSVGRVSPCLLVDLQTLLPFWRQYLIDKNELLQETFLWGHFKADKDGVTYKNYVAQKIICCEGVAGFVNPFFKNLPYTRMKGEALIVLIPGLPRTNIYKQGINIVPWKDDLFWIGSTYEWNFNDMSPTPAWRKKVEEQLSYWLKLPFNVIDHLASERPANMERRPFVGLHPQNNNVAIFNGMGAKGCSLAPFFAHQLATHLIDGLPIYDDADVKRFEKVLARKMI